MDILAVKRVLMMPQIAPIRMIRVDVGGATPIGTAGDAGLSIIDRQHHFQRHSEALDFHAVHEQLRA